MSIKVDLAYRIGQLTQNGFPWQRKDLALLRAALAEIMRLEGVAS